MITSTSNAKIKDLVRLKKSAGERRERGIFLVEGPRMFFETPGERLREAYVTEDFAQKYPEKLAGISCELISENVCRAISDTKTPQGVVAVVERREFSMEDLLQREENPCLLILEDLQDPGNLGTILRTAEAAGATGVILTRGTVDIYNPKVIRATMGSLFRLPFVRAGEIREILLTMREAGIETFAAHLDGETFYGKDYRGGCAFLIGNEGNGLSREAFALAGQRIRIPMRGRVESLNAATAAAVLLYEAARQRGFA